MANITESENNNVRTSANSFTTKDTVSGKISAANDTDCFKILLNGYGNVTFKLNIPSNVNYRMRIFKGNSTSAIAEDVSTTLGTQRIATFNAQGDWYYVVISPQNNLFNANTNYTLSVTPTTATSINLTASPNSISIGGTSNITTTITPSNAYTDLTYSTTSSCISFNTSYYVIGQSAGTGSAKLYDAFSGKTGTASITVTPRTIIDIPSTRICNWNQFYTGITNVINSTAGCAYVCGLDIANIYGRSSGTAGYTASDMSGTTYWSNIDGYQWKLPSTCKGSFSSSYSYDRASGNTDAQRLTAIRSEINNNRPVVVGLYNSTDSEDKHFVVAYGYTGTGTTTSQIKVYDPARSKTDTTTSTGRDTTLDNAISFNSKTGMEKLRLTSGNR